MQHADRPILAIAFRLAGFALISTMLAIVKYVSETGVAIVEIIFWRQVLTIPIVLTGLWLGGGLHRLRTRRLSGHATRAVMGMAAMVLMFLATIILPLAESTTLNFTTPIFAALIAALVLRQTVGPWRWSAILLGFAGVVIIAQPGSAAISPLGIVMGLTSGLLVAAVSYQIRDLSRTDEPVACVFYFSVFGSIVPALLLPFFMTAHTPFQWLLLMAIGAIGAAGQYCITTALKHGAVATVIVMDYSALLWAAFYGYLIWDQFPALSTWIGAGVVILSGLIIVWRQRVHLQQVPPTSAQEVD